MDCRYGRGRIDRRGVRAGAARADVSEDCRYGTVDRLSGTVGAERRPRDPGGVYPGARTESNPVEGGGGLNEADMILRVARRASLSKAEAAVAVDGLFEAVRNAPANGDSVGLTGFDTFSVRSRPARIGRNPQTGESIEIAASKSAAFRAGKTLRDAVR